MKKKKIISQKDEKEKPMCYRCGVSKVKGFWEGGCSSWGTYYKRHIWKIIIKPARRLDELTDNLASQYRIREYFKREGIIK